MRPPPWRRLGLAAGVLALAGCAATVPVVVQPVICPVDAALVAGRCATPKAIPERASFGDVLTLYQQDRQALQNCAQRAETLARLIEACQATMVQYNQRLLEINRANTTKP